jgi:hypothetical protein
LVQPGAVDEIYNALLAVEDNYDAIYPADVPEPFKWKNIAKMWREIL